MDRILKPLKKGHEGEKKQTVKYASLRTHTTYNYCDFYLKGHFNTKNTYEPQSQNESKSVPKWRIGSFMPKIFGQENLRKEENKERRT